MKLVKIKINNRVDRILNFDEPIQLHNNTFIIRDYSGGMAELFRIDKDAIIITDQGHLPLIIKRIDSNNGILDVYFSTKKIDSESKSSRVFFGRGRSNAVDQNDTIKGLTLIKEKTEEDSQQFWVYQKQKPKNDDHYELRFHLEVPSSPDEEEVPNNTEDVEEAPTNEENAPKIEDERCDIKPISIFVYYATTDETFDAIVDFGSEASQALWRNKNDQAFIDLTASILNQHSSIAGKSKQDFVQFESKQLYKSIYYLKKELKESDLTTWPVYDGNLWKFLVANDDLTTLKDYMQLPNTKLFNFDISEYTELEVLQDNETVLLKRLGNEENVIGRILMNNIVCQVLYAIKKNLKKLNSAYVVLNILMPNVYPIHLVSEKLDHLAIDVTKFLKDSSDFNRIKAIELRSISESDASFLGYYNSKKGGFQHGKYLIMDAGKGTLDFSIMEFAEVGVPFVNKSRSGIVGAGNAITYGLLVGLVNDFMLTVLTGYKDINDKHTLIKEFIYKLFFEEQDIAKKMELLKAVENYKKTYNQLYLKEPGKIEKNDEVSFRELGEVFSDNKDKDSFLKFIERLTQNDNNKTGTNLSEESQKYVTIEIENIVNAAVRKLDDITTSDTNIIGIIFTGRGFLMHELQEVMRRQLIDHKIISEGTPIKIGEEKDNEMKKICMEINQLLVSDKYDASPSRQSVAVHHGGIFAEDRANASTKIEEQGRTTETSTEFEDDDSHGGYHEASEDDYAQATNISPEKIESVGIPVGKLTNASSIIIAGWRYDVNQKFQGKEGTLFFDGFKYCLTADGVSQQISANIANPSASSLGYESLFPNVNLQNKNGVKIPTAIKEPNAKKKEAKEGMSSSGDAPANETDTTTINDQVTDEQSSTIRKTKKKVKRSKLKSFFEDFTSLISGGTAADDEPSDANQFDTN